MNSDRPPNGKSIAPLKNVAELLTLVDMLVDQPQDGDRFGMFSGFSGYGKSWACDYVKNVRDPIYIEIFSYWTRKDFVSFLLQETGGSVGHKQSLSRLMQEVIERLSAEPDRPLIIDEADQLVDRGMIELVRDLQKAVGLPVILVGEELLPQKLQRFERVDGRVLGRSLAQPCDVDDAKVLARFKCPDISVSEALLAAIVRDTGGSARRIANTLANVRSFSVMSGLKALDIDTYSGGIFTGAPLLRHKRGAE